MIAQKTIYKKLLGWFLLLTLVPLLIASTLTFFSSKDALVREINNNLITITRSKAEQLETYINNTKLNVVMLSHMPTITEMIKLIEEDPTATSNEVRQEILKFNLFLTEYFKDAQYRNVVLLNTRGEILFDYTDRQNSFRQSLQIVAPNSELKDVFEQAKTLQEVNISNFFYDRRLRTPSFLIAAPVLERKRVIGVLVIQIDDTVFSEIVNNYTGLGLTGETLVGIKTEDSIVLVSPTRHNPNAALEYREPLVSESLSPLQQAVRGTISYGRMRDYRDRITLAAWRYLPSLDGGMVVKIDEAEALKAVVTQRNSFIILVTLTVIIVAILSRYIARSIAYPIIQLSKVVQRFAQGYLSEKAPILTQDEIGFLAESFNQMSSQLNQTFQSLETINHALEERVAQRTLELEKAHQEILKLNEQLTAENLRMSSELEITRQLQQMILPKESELTRIDALEIVGFMEPASEIGGDYYDILSYGDRVFIGIGDVTGHGLESGVLMIMVQTAVRTLIASEETNLIKFFEVLNRTIYDNVRRINSEKHLTLALLNYQEGTLTLSGQHEEVILVRSNGSVERIDTMDLGFPIGLDDNIVDFIAQSTIHLESGDIVVLYTDGITEAENPENLQYGIDALCKVVQQNSHRTAQQIREAVIEDLKHHIGVQTIYDDITLVVIKQR